MRLHAAILSVCLSLLQHDVHGKVPEGSESAAEGYQRHLADSPLIREAGRVRVPGGAPGVSSDTATDAPGVPSCTVPGASATSAPDASLSPTALWVQLMDEVIC